MPIKVVVTGCALRALFYFGTLVYMSVQQHTIALNGTPVIYMLKRNRQAKRIKIAVSAGGVLSVTIPYRFSQTIVDRILSEHADWIIETIGKLKERGGRFTRYTREHYLEHREAARVMAHERVAYFNRRYGFRFAGISIRDQKTRWGSCSRDGNLNFNYKIVLLPPCLADYVIVHELCHLGEFNHSPKFWNLVAQTIPNHRDLRKQLRYL